MNLHPQRCLVVFLALTTVQALVPTTARAELLPPGDFNGTPQTELGLDWVQWAVATGLGGQSLPDTIDGIRYLPANFGGGDFVTDLTIELGTPLIVSPFFVIGEQYDDGTADNPADPFIDTIFAETTIETTFDGSVILEGTTSDMLDRRFAVTVFSAPIPYADPQPRGSINAVSSIFGTGLVTIFDDLPVGEHTIRNEFNSTIFGAASYTYNVNVVPEPASVVTAGIGALALSLLCVPLRARRAST